MTGPVALGDAGERLRAAVLDRFEMAPHEVEMLDSTCRLADVIAGLDDAVARDGLTTTTATGAVRVNPCVSESRQAGWL